jgi:hypothetical protein
MELSMRMSRTVLTLGVIATLGLASGLGCSKKKAAPVASEKAPAAPSAVPPARTIPGGLASLPKRLQEEARSRPDGTPKAEEVFTNFAAAGLALGTPRQYLGATLGASYCAGGRTESGLQVAVCEFPSADAARKGKELSLSQFEQVKNREIILNRGTMLTITLTTGHTEHTAQAKQMAEIFHKM